MGKRYAHGVLGPANGVLWRRDIPVPGQFYRSHMANSQKETKIIPGYSSFGLIRTFSLRPRNELFKPMGAGKTRPLVFLEPLALMPC